MRLSTHTRYGIRAMIELAGAYGKGPLQLKVISDRQDISVKYLEHLMASLKSVGLVTSVRGSKGGYMLAKAPALVRLIDCFNCLEGPSGVVVECLDDEGSCDRVTDCVTRQVWVQVRDAVESVLRSVTLDDLARKARVARPFDYQI